MMALPISRGECGLKIKMQSAKLKKAFEKISRKIKGDF